MKELVKVHYGEIGIKGKNKPDFERLLIKNIKIALENEQIEQVILEESRIHIYFKTQIDRNKITIALNKVFGIVWFSFAYEIEKDLEKINLFVRDKLEKNKEKTVVVDSRRSDKKFEKTSIEINKDVGKTLFDNGFKIDIHKPDITVYIEILLLNKAIIYFEKNYGLGGLPVGCSGKVLLLLSGGIDSPAAAYLMMKRGCDVDYLHISVNKNIDKIKKLIEKLNEYSLAKSKLYNAEYDEFYKKTFEINAREEVVLFKRFITKLAEKVARENNYLAIVNGDNLAQVASQTLENILATEDGTNLPIFRPLISYDKKEIIDLAKRIGTYETSLEEYKDCCSLVSSKNPSTKAKLDYVKKLDQMINLDQIIDRTISKMEKIEI
ncbi:MAG: tRNA uracil 4-sulfurtransferase ThiI [Candidatus Micrarchaeota archaeon]